MIDKDDEITTKETGEETELELSNGKDENE